MKIKQKEVSYEYAISRSTPKHKNPVHPSFLLQALVKAVAAKDLKETHFTYTKTYQTRAPKGPYLILMNHSSFIDLEMMAEIFFPMPYHIVCTSDGFVGKEWLMRHLGCIPTRKFVTDITLVKDMLYALHEKKTSVLMYPEASYSFDGCPTPLPRKLGVFLKKLAVPVLMVKTKGAFLRDPLYNCLQKRPVDVSATVECLFTPEEIEAKSVEELDKGLDEAFSFDHFAQQKEEKISVDAPFRADGLHRILYRCPQCGTEGEMEGKGIHLTCRHCRTVWTMNEYGVLSQEGGETKFSHIPQWYQWERDTVKRALFDGSYSLDVPVSIGIMTDYKAIYMVGDGRLCHTENGFTLTSCDGRLSYTQSPLSSYGLYADYFWYEIGDVICIGDKKALYYCFPKTNTPVAKARLAAEELYKIKKKP